MNIIDETEEDGLPPPHAAATEDFDEKRLKAAQSVVYGWPSTEAEPTKPQDQGRFPKSFPLEFAMGVADLFDERTFKNLPRSGASTC